MTTFGGFRLGAVHCLQLTQCKVLRTQEYRWLMAVGQNKLIIKSDSRELGEKNKLKKN